MKPEEKIQQLEFKLAAQIDLCANLGRVIGLKNGAIEERDNTIRAIVEAMQADEADGIAVVNVAPKTWSAILDSLELSNSASFDAGQWGEERAQLEAKIAELETEIARLKAEAAFANMRTEGEA